MQRMQRNVSKRVMHVQSCCFVCTLKLTFFFCLVPLHKSSRCRPRRCCMFCKLLMLTLFDRSSFTFVKFKLHRCASACLRLVVKEMVTLNAKRSRAVLIFDWLTKKRQYVMRTIFILRPRQKLAIRRQENLKETTRLCRVS